MGSVCDRCSQPYLAVTFPSHLCPNCFLGGLPARERARLLGHVAATGQRL